MITQVGMNRRFATQQKPQRRADKKQHTNVKTKIATKTREKQNTCTDARTKNVMRKGNIKQGRKIPTSHKLGGKEILTYRFSQA